MSSTVAILSAMEDDFDYRGSARNLYPNLVQFQGFFAMINKWEARTVIHIPILHFPDI